MKIAIVCLNLKWQAGGARLIYSLAHQLQNQGNKVRIYAPEISEETFPELRRGLDIVVVPPPYPFEWTKNPKGFVKRMIRKFQQELLHGRTGKMIAAAMDDDFDILNVHDFAYKTGRFYKKRNPRVKVIWTMNDPPYIYLPKDNFVYDLLSKFYNFAKDILEKKYFRAVTSVVVLDFFNRDWAKARGLRPQVIRSGVDFENFFSPVREHTLQGRTVNLLALGALNRYRRFEDIVLAVKILRDAGRDVRALIICKDIWEEEACKNGLIALRKENNLEEYVEFRFNGATNEELRAAYQKGDIFILPTYLPPPRNGYGWGLTNFEAMAAGLPLIICETTTATEVLENRKNVLLVRPMSPSDIAERVGELIDDPVLYKTIASNGQALVKDDISWKKYAEAMVRVFTE